MQKPYPSSSTEWSTAKERDYVKNIGTYGPHFTQQNATAAMNGDRTDKSLRFLEYRLRLLKNYLRSFIHVRQRFGSIEKDKIIVFTENQIKATEKMLGLS